ncbi:hypothetical protein WJX77_005066 [Trebouxia sp. C0004]
MKGYQRLLTTMLLSDDRTQLVRSRKPAASTSDVAWWQRPDPAASAGPSSAITDEAAAGNDAARPAAQLAPPEPYEASSGAEQTATGPAPVSGSLPNSEVDQGTSTVTGPHSASCAASRAGCHDRCTTDKLNAPALIRSAAAAAVSQGPSGIQDNAFRQSLRLQKKAAAKDQGTADLSEGATPAAKGKQVRHTRQMRNRGNFPHEMRPVITCAIEYPDEEMERKALRTVVAQFTDDPELAMQKPEQMIAQGVHFQVHVHRGTSDFFLFYKGTAVFFHPQPRQHQ